MVLSSRSRHLWCILRFFFWFVSLSDMLLSSPNCSISRPFPSVCCEGQPFITRSAHLISGLCDYVDRGLVEGFFDSYSERECNFLVVSLAIPPFNVVEHLLTRQNLPRAVPVQPVLMARNAEAAAKLPRKMRPKEQSAKPRSIVRTSAACTRRLH
ncbi:hypothetical protein EDB83DRAFT_1226088 [Lactarius deliciosus]|nr:hypothetical protein EDB83DRAFT_1226088 [Lactarius deliciosus]